MEFGPAGAPNSALARISSPPRSDRNFTSLARIPGLKASTSYRYRVLVDGVPAPEAQFTTAPHAHKPLSYSYFVASCMDYKQLDKQHVWDMVAGQKAAFNLLAGDNVYADNTNHDVLWNAHMAQRGIPNFARLLSTTPTFATWDDHDFGPNDSHGGTPGKENSLRAFKDLWPNPSYGLSQTPGVFFSYHWANVQFIVLDARYHRTDEKAPHTAEKTQYGSAQLEWLFQQLKASRSPFKVIVSGYDIMSDHFPNDSRKIAQFIKDNRIYGVIAHSGDIHRNDIKRKDLGMGYPLTQITSSGITRVFARPWVMMDVNTTLPDPTLSARFFTHEKLDSTVAFKLSSLTPPNVSDLILNNPVGGEDLAAGAQAGIEWTRVGTGIGRVNIDYSLGSHWISIAKDVPNSGSYKWNVPNIISATAKVRVSDATNQVQSESPGVFRIIGPSRIGEGEGEGPISIRLPGGREVRLRVPHRVESVRVYDIQGTLIMKVPILQGIAVWTAPGSGGDGNVPGLHIIQPVFADGSKARSIIKFIF